jgi:hypothetical protein
MKIVAVVTNVLAGLHKRPALNISVAINRPAVGSTGHTAQFAIVIHNVATALLEVVQTGFTPVAIAGLTTRMEIITSGGNVPAGLQVRTARTIHALISARVRAGCSVISASTAQRTVVIDNIASAALERGKLRVSPMAAVVLAVGYEHGSIYGDVIAGLLIRSLGNTLRKATCSQRQ